MEKLIKHKENSAVGHYESPQSSVMDILPEGVLCGSLGFTHEGFGDGNGDSSDGFLDGGSFDL